MMYRLHFARLGLAGLLGLFIMPLSANEFAQLKLSTGTQDNVARALHAEDEERSTYARAELGAGKLMQLGLNDSLTVNASIAKEKHFSFSGFDNSEAGVSLALQHKFGFGPYTPRIAAELGATRQFYRGQARDNTLLSAALSLEKRFNPALRLSAAIDMQTVATDTLPDNPEVSAFGYSPTIRLPYELFDYDSQGIQVSADYTFVNRIILMASVRRTNGSTVASTTNPTFKTYKVSSAFYADPAFNEGWFAYRLDANTNDWSMAVSLPLGQDSAIDLAARYLDIAGPARHHYQNRLFTLTFVQNF